jgi:hypothetical protein
LIAEYWKKHKKEKGRKSLDVKPPKAGRKSMTAREKSPELGSSAATKRRKSQIVTESDQENGDDDDKPAGKKRKSTGTTTQSTSKKAARKIEDEIVGDDLVIGDMTPYMNVADWDHLISNIDTVERSDNSLLVYFTLCVTSLPIVTLGLSELGPGKALVNASRKIRVFVQRGFPRRSVVCYFETSQEL